jgi:hypothetical protein
VVQIPVEPGFRLVLPAAYFPSIGCRKPIILWDPLNSSNIDIVLLLPFFFPWYFRVAAGPLQPRQTRPRQLPARLAVFVVYEIRPFKTISGGLELPVGIGKCFYIARKHSGGCGDYRGIIGGRTRPADGGFLRRCKRPGTSRPTRLFDPKKRK